MRDDEPLGQADPDEGALLWEQAGEPQRPDEPQRPEARPGRSAARRRRRRRRLAVLAVAIIVPLAIGGGYANWAFSGAGEGRPVSIVVPRGATAMQTADLLADGGVVRAPWLFRLYIRWKGVGGEIKAGEYRLRTGMGYAAVLAELRKGPAIEVVRVTIPEGKTVQETAAIFERQTGIEAADFLSTARSGRHRASIMPEGLRNLEGFLFPNTYDFEKDVDADGSVARLVRQFDRATADVDWSRARALRITPYQAVVIASMIEREAKVARERRLMSAVIHNRLRRGMRLQIDATVQYAILLETGRYKPRLTFADYEIESRYNTYRIDGVPPAPIASPGLESIRAALDPADVDYLYYVLKNDRGEHAFASSFSEFQRLLRERDAG